MELWKYLIIFIVVLINKSSTGELLINNSLLGGPISSNHENETTQYQEELTGIKKNIENISDTVSYLELMVKKIYDAESSNNKYIDMRRQADGASRIPLSIVLNWMEDLCSNVLKEAQKTYSNAEKFRNSIDLDNKNPVYIRNIREQLEKYEAILTRHVDELKELQIRLNIYEKDNRLDKDIVTEETFPPSKYFYYNNQPDEENQHKYNESSTSDDREDFRSRLIHILKFYKVYVPTKEEENLAAKGTKPDKNEEENSQSPTHIIPPYHTNTEPNSGTVQGSATRTLVQENEDVRSQLNTVSSKNSSQPNQSATTLFEDGGTNLTESCDLDQNLVIMVVIFSTSPLLLVIICMYYAFCHKVKTVNPETDNESEKDKACTETYKQKDNQYVKISMLPQK